MKWLHESLSGGWFIDSLPGPARNVTWWLVCEKEGFYQISL
jgi:hypothetical protein